MQTKRLSHPVRRALWRACLPAAFFIATTAVPTSGQAGPITPTAADITRRDTLGARIPDARLLWVNYGEIWYSPVGDWSPQNVTNSALDESNPRWSPDGTQILFARDLEGVLVMSADFTGEQLLIDGAHTPSWTRDGRFITAIANNNHEVVRYELATGNLEVIFDSHDPEYNGFDVGQSVELRVGQRYMVTWFAENSSHHETQIVDLLTKTYIGNADMARGDCSPSWAPDGGYILNTARTSSRPVVNAMFTVAGGTIAASNIMVGLDDQCQCNQFYIHGERVANDMEWMTFGGWIKDGPLQDGSREIYLWKIGDPVTEATRFTFNTAEDHSPDLWVPMTGCRDPDGDGYGIGPACVDVDCDDTDPRMHRDAAELCNGADDDCDGQVDEDFSNLGAPCAVGLGACEVTGEVICAADGSATCDATAATPAATEICDGAVDDDCDGTIDNGCSCTDGDVLPCYGGGPDTLGVGPCGGGNQACNGGALGTCTGQVLPAGEICDDGVDNDCDGLTDGDDGIDCGGGSGGGATGSGGAGGTGGTAGAGEPDPAQDPPQGGRQAGALVADLTCQSTGNAGGGLLAALGLWLALAARRRRCPAGSRPNGR